MRSNDLDYIVPTFYSNLKWHLGGYNRDEYYVLEDDSCVSIGSAIAQELSIVDTSDAFKISRGALHRLMSYYIEAGIMRPEGHEAPFTEIAEKIARRHRLVERDGADFLLRSGLVEVTEKKPSIIDDEIPF